MTLHSHKFFHLYFLTTHGNLKFFKVEVVDLIETYVGWTHTKAIQKVSTVCTYLSHILETVPLHMCSDFLYQLRSHRHHFMKFILCLCLFLCVKHVWDNWRGRRLWNRSVIRFLKARSVLPSEIHHQTFQVYGDNAMSDGMVRKWVRMFSEGWENVHDEARRASIFGSSRRFQQGRLCAPYSGTDKVFSW